MTSPASGGLTERFETNFVDLDGPQGLLGQTSGRTKVNVIAWLDARGQAWKDAVQVVAMDPCATYRAAVREALPVNIPGAQLADGLIIDDVCPRTTSRVGRGTA